jgi:PleD family two-component response regulator
MLKNDVRRNVDIPARYGGEEFVVILPHTAAAGAEVVGERLVRRISDLEGPVALPPAGAGAGVVAERIRHDIEKTLFPALGGRRGAHMTVSVGVAAFSAQALTPADLVHNADKAMYMAKRKGKNRVEVFE